ncbi:class I SAM-dependent methyltransferase [Pseudactinotalea sp. Z1748]|uniref:class I SAM-dependent methyltransferase n=1 Tax=Pseudactinotalea sp. Z1748 TaxID=3413027 RepID=UPI003C7D481A
MMRSQYWTEAAAAGYDHPDAPMFSAEVLDPTVGFLAELAGRAGGGRALEFAIGTGRVAVPLWRRGVEVHGIDTSEPMIARLRTKASDQDIPVTVGDMSTTRVPGEFDLVYLVYNTISNLLTQEAQVDCFRNAAAHLVPGGHFVIELGVPPLRWLPPGAAAVPFEVTERHVGLDTIDPLSQRMTSHHFTRGDDGRYRYGPSEHRYAWPAELDLMARLAGMELVERVADFHRAPFTSEATSHVSVWRRPTP